jgi:hypothetical protein
MQQMPHEVRNVRRSHRLGGIPRGRIVHRLLFQHFIGLGKNSGLGLAYLDSDSCINPVVAVLFLAALGITPVAGNAAISSASLPAVRCM